jgi:hypothetical protein
MRRFDVPGRRDKEWDIRTDVQPGTYRASPSDKITTNRLSCDPVKTGNQNLERDGIVGTINCVWPVRTLEPPDAGKIMVASDARDAGRRVADCGGRYRCDA